MRERQGGIRKFSSKTDRAVTGPPDAVVRGSTSLVSSVFFTTFLFVWGHDQGQGLRSGSCRIIVLIIEPLFLLYKVSLIFRLRNEMRWFSVVIQRLHSHCTKTINQPNFNLN